MKAPRAAVLDTLHRAFTSFLAVPTGVVVVFLLLAIGTYTVDQANVAWLRPTRDVLQRHVFADAQATSSLLSTIATGVITVTSITFSLLLLALQQSAGSMTHSVFDQFLRRCANQVYFGYFVGMALFSLITLATVDPPFNPVFGATLALILVMVALYLLLLLIYSTVSQMRPEAILQSIHDHTLLARERQQPLLQTTRRTPRLSGAKAIPVISEANGFVTFNFPALSRVLESVDGEAEIVLLHAEGTFVAFHDTVAEVRLQSQQDGTMVAAAVRQAVGASPTRRLESDPSYGIEQMEMIAWRSISTSQQNPAPGLAAIRNLRDLLARWAVEPPMESAPSPLPIVYPDDVIDRLITAFESLIVVASEAMRHQIYAEVVRSFALTFERLPGDLQGKIEAVVLRSLPALGDHVLTQEMERTIDQLLVVLEREGRNRTAVAVSDARSGLAGTVGTLQSRSTRVPAL